MRDFWWVQGYKAYPDEKGNVGKLVDPDTGAVAPGPEKKWEPGQHLAIGTIRTAISERRFDINKYMKLWGKVE